MSVLVNVHTGLNDSLGGLLCAIDNTLRSNSNLSHIHFTHHFYKKLDTFFNFKTVKYIDTIHPKQIKQYNNIFNTCSDKYTANYSTKFINEHLTIKDEHIAKAIKYHNYIGIVFRTKSLEFSPHNSKIETNRFLKKFWEIYKTDEKYVIFSDACFWRELLCHKNNIEFVLPSLNINVTDKQLKRQNRNLCLDLTIQTICSMSTCKQLYYTKGGFFNLSRLITDTLSIKSLL